MVAEGRLCPLLHPDVSHVRDRLRWPLVPTGPDSLAQLCENRGWNVSIVGYPAAESLHEANATCRRQTESAGLSSHAKSVDGSFLTAVLGPSVPLHL